MGALLLDSHSGLLYLSPLLRQAQPNVHKPDAVATGPGPCAKGHCSDSRAESWNSHLPSG